MAQEGEIDDAEEHFSREKEEGFMAMDMEW